MSNARHISTTTPERFFHLRQQIFTGSDDKPRALSALTAFARKEPNGDWYAAIAECDHRDQFCRKTGRNVARRKWFAGKRVPVVGDATFKAVFAAVGITVPDVSIAEDTTNAVIV